MPLYHLSRQKEEHVKKVMNAIALAADLAPGAVLVIGGVAVMVGGATGVLWL